MPYARSLHARVGSIETMRWLPEDAGVHQVLANTGMKINVGGSYLLTANMLFRLTDLGLSARVVPSVTLDYTFGR
jgi:hypothetical protein